MATNGALGAWRRRSRQNNSMSPITSTAAARASPTDQCGAGWVSGTPGESTSAAMSDQSMRRRSAVAKPSRAASAMRLVSSSQTITAAPPAASARQQTSPEPPSPNTATFLPAKVVTGITMADRSPQLERVEARERKHDRDDPEPDHD